MKRFSQLLVTLILKTSRNDKISVLSEYFKYTPDPDRGYALGALTGTLSIPGIKPSLLRTLVAERIDQELFNLQCWALTADSFFSKDEWEWILKSNNYNRDYELIYFS